ncbi:hypothetical protein J5751_05995 [bacterium]|nr:hypothetical protein [bacterium]
MEEKIKEMVQQFKETHNMDIFQAAFYEMGLRKQVELKDKREISTAEFCFSEALKEKYPRTVEEYFSAKEAYTLGFCANVLSFYGKI